MKFEAVNLIKCTTLAYVGDAVFTLFVRERLSADPTIPTRELMRRCSRTVSAVVQAQIHDAILGELDEDELALMQRCRNAHLTNKAKNATMREYKKATALEGLLGALRLIGDNERLNKLLNRCVEVADE